MEISDSNYELVKQRAFNHYSQNRKINSPKFGTIHVDIEGFKHIEYKDKKKKKKRPRQEAYIRYMCFLHFDYIIQNSHLYQDYLERYEKIIIKRNGRYIFENKLVKYFGFIAIVNKNQQRVKILIKKVDGWTKYQYVSVIPVWKTTNNGPQLYLDHESDL